MAGQGGTGPAEPVSSFGATGRFPTPPGVRCSRLWQRPPLERCSLPRSRQSSARSPGAAVFPGRRRRHSSIVATTAAVAAAVATIGGTLTGTSGASLSSVDVGATSESRTGAEAMAPAQCGARRLTACWPQAAKRRSQPDRGNHRRWSGSRCHDLGEDLGERRGRRRQGRRRRRHGRRERPWHGRRERGRRRQHRRGRRRRRRLRGRRRGQRGRRPHGGRRHGRRRHGRRR